MTLAIATVVLLTQLSNVGVVSRSVASIEVGHTDAIRMLSERVSIVPQLGPVPDGDRVVFDCLFTLNNSTVSETTIEVAFPIESKVELSDLSPTDLVIGYQFIARDERETYHAQYVHRALAGRSAFVWRMTFMSGETKLLRVVCTLPMTAYLGSTRIDSPVQDTTVYGRPWFAALESSITEKFTYLTETGKSWKGSIDEATFSVHTAGMSYWIGKRGTEIPLLAPSGDATSLPVGLNYLQRSTGDWENDISEGSVISTARDYEPKGPVEFVWYGTPFPSAPDDCDILVQRLMGKNPSREEVIELTQIVGAFYGLQPESESVKQFVEKQVWYHPSPEVSRTDLTLLQQEILSRLESIARNGK